MGPGNTPINIHERQFTMAEAAFLTGNVEKNIRNWRAREVLEVGEKHFLGRLAFSYLDLVQLTVMRDLTALSFPIADAAAMAEAVAMRAVELGMRDPVTGRLVEGADGTRPNVNFILAFEGDKVLTTRADIKTPGNYYPPRHTNKATAPLRRVHVVVPADAIIGDLTERVAELVEKRRRAGASLAHDRTSRDSPVP